LVEKGCSQVLEIDFGNIFSCVANVASIRLLYLLAFYFEVEQMDVKKKSSRGSRRRDLHEAT